jgi:hypothetical protein
MEKGLEIDFQLQSENEDIRIVEALAAITTYDLKDRIEMDYRIFHVRLGEHRFYRILFAGKSVNKLHPHNMKTIKEYFDGLAKQGADELINKYNKLLKEKDTVKHPIKEVEEEYDLWQDPIWQYI